MVFLDYVLKAFAGFGNGVIAEGVHFENIEREQNVGY